MNNPNLGCSINQVPSRSSGGPAFLTVAAPTSGSVGSLVSGASLSPVDSAVIANFS